MSKFKNGYTEVYEILNNLKEEDYDKIPPEVIKTIEENRNEVYKFELDNDLPLHEQTLLSETKAILFNLFRDYLSTSEQKEKIIRMQNEERQKNELKKQQMYSSNVFNSQNKEDTTKQEVQEEKLEMIEYKEPFWVRVLGKLKSIFYKK